MPKAGRYKVEISYGATRAAKDKEFLVGIGDKSVGGKIVETGNDWVFQSHQLGTLNLQAGAQTLQVKSGNSQGLGGVSLESVKLIPQP